MNVILLTLVVSLALAGILGFLLGVFKKLFYVAVDPAESSVRAVLPGSNCGACGYPGCDALASAIAGGLAPVGACTAGGAATAKAVGLVMGVDGVAETQVAVLLCQGTSSACPPKARYVGVKTCLAAKISSNGTRLCDWGCIGLGDCERVCPFDAIRMGEDGIPHVDYRKCTGCGICVAECPRKILARVARARTGAVTLCQNRSEKKAQVRKNCSVGCVKCGMCEKVCPLSCIRLDDGIPEVDYAICDSCGECVRKCPTKSLSLVELTVKEV
jgi:Na+-translocating ferredoxin:NAD+ oxidoreductase RNF subunit RnfB